MITEKLTPHRKFMLISATVLYFVVGFFVVLITVGYVLGSNDAGLLALIYIGLGWYFLIKRNGLFYIMGIKHD